MQTEVLRIIEGGLANDRRKILAYSNRLADRLEREGDTALSRCIRQKLIEGVPQNAAVADAVKRNRVHPIFNPFIKPTPSDKTSF